MIEAHRNPHMVTFSDIRRAAERLADVAFITPVLSSPLLDEASQATVFLKCENFQRTGSFKFRGAYNALAELQQEGTLNPIVTLSSGNHAQGIALACQLHGRAAHIVMPEPINPMKRAAVHGYGAIIHTTGSRAGADARLKELLRELSGVYVHAFNDPLVIAGQGTAVLELLSATPDVDVVLGPIGGGGLLSGACLAAHGLKPKLAVYACEPAGALDAMHSVRENRIVPMPNPHTIAEGLRTSVGDVTLPILREHLTDFFIVEEHEIINAMRFAYERLKIVIEPSSAVALAPLLRQEHELVGKRVGVVVTGGNVDLSAFFQTLS